MPLTFHEALGRLTLPEREMVEAIATSDTVTMEEVARRHNTYLGNLYNDAIHKLAEMGFYINDVYDHFRGAVLPPPDGEGDDALHT